MSDLSQASESANVSSSASAIGNINSVVAVLLIHIEWNAVDRMNPKTICLGWLPMRLMMCSEIRRCSSVSQSPVPG